MLPQTKWSTLFTEFSVSPSRSVTFMEDPGTTSISNDSLPRSVIIFITASSAILRRVIRHRHFVNTGISHGIIPLRTNKLSCGIARKLGSKLFQYPFQDRTKRYRMRHRDGVDLVPSRITMIYQVCFYLVGTSG